MKTISQRELRNHVSRVLQQVEAGGRMRITVDGRAVADLVPIGGVRRSFVPIDDCLRAHRSTGNSRLMSKAGPARR